jgi:hypothetical protein
MWDTFAYHDSKWGKLVDAINAGRLTRYFYEIINLVASIVTIVSFAVVTIKSKTPEFWYVIILFAYLGIVVIFAFVQSCRYARKSRYAEASRIFHPIAHILRDAMYHVKEMEEPIFERTLERILTALSSGLEIVTGTKVRACIKLLKVDGGITDLKGLDVEHRKDKIYAETYVQDPNSYWPKKNYSDYPYDKDRLSCNSAFCSIFRGDCDYFLENNIPRAYKRRRYENSSFMIYGKGVYGGRAWILPYRSTILWPIRKLLKPITNSLHREPLIETHDVLGFLCVDSASRNVWASRYDTQIGASVADLLYLFMDKWFETHWTDHHPAMPAKNVSASQRPVN